MTNLQGKESYLFESQLNLLQFHFLSAKADNVAHPLLCQTQLVVLSIQRQVKCSNGSLFMSDIEHYIEALGNTKKKSYSRIVSAGKIPL